MDGRMEAYGWRRMDKEGWMEMEGCMNRGLDS